MTSASTNWAFADLWDEIADVQPHAPALLHGQRIVDWRGFDRAADGVAQWLLDLGLGPRDLVAICMRNRPEHLVTVYGCLKVAAVPAISNARSTTAELAELWSRSGVRAVVHDDPTAPAVTPLAALLPEVRGWLRVGSEAAGAPTANWAEVVRVGAAGRRRAPASGARSGNDNIVLFTGGTTGPPKGVVWRQDDLFSVLDRTTRRPWGAVDRDAAGAVRDVERVIRRGDVRAARLVVAAPLMHGLGALTAMSALSTTGTVATLTRSSFDAFELLDTVGAVMASQTAIVGDAMARPVLEAVALHPGRWTLPTLRVLLSSGSRWSPEVKQAVIAEFPHVRCVDVLGATEAIGVARSVTTSDHGAGVVHFELGPDAAVVDEHGVPVAPGSETWGRVVVRGRRPLGYLGETDDRVSSPDDSWTELGDWASVEPNGRVVVHGRGSEVINTGGEKVFPEEVEQAVATDPAIRDVVVLGVDHLRLGQQVVALVELAPGAGLDADREPADIADRVRDRLGDTLARYKLPRSVHVLTSLGRRPDGKVDRRALQHHAERLERDRVT